jgi:hypothetical protein
MGVGEEDLPSLRIVVSGEEVMKEKYEYPYNFDDFTADDIGNFIDGVKDGSIE